MNPGKYNVLFMRDDRRVKRFRFSLGWVKFLILVQVLLLVLAGAGGYFSVVFFKKNRELKSEISSLRSDLRKSKTNLRRLENVRNILKSFDEGDVLTALKKGDNGTESSSSGVNLERVFKNVDKHIISVDQLQASIKESRVNLRFELNNLISDKKLEGLVSIELVGRDGMVVQLDVQDEDLYFEINHFKKVKTSFQLPEAISQKELFAIRLTITNKKDQVIYSETFPLSDILV